LYYSDVEVVLPRWITPMEAVAVNLAQLVARPSLYKKKVKGVQRKGKRRANKTQQGHAKAAKGVSEGV
jgi:hypothetical protein